MIQSFAVMWSILLLVNVVVSAIQWRKTKLALYRTVLIFWATGVLTLLLGAVSVGQGILIRLYLSSAIFLFAWAAATLLSSLTDIRLRTRPLIGGMLVSLAITPVLHFAGAHPTLVSLPITLAGSAPMCITAYDALRKGKLEISTRLLAWLLLIDGIHLIDYAILGQYPETAPWGFGIGLAIGLAISVLAPGAIVERVTEESTRLRVRAEFESRLIHSAKMAALGEMAGGIAHEINNPLMIITSTAELLKLRSGKGPVGVDDVRNSAIRISETSYRIALIVRGMRTFARDSRNDKKAPEPLDQLLESTFALCTENLRSAKIRLEVDPVPALTLSCRSAEISQVLINLIQNSRDAVLGQPGSWIRISFGHDSDKFRIAVTDSGPGIPDEIASKMMEPFFTTKPPGSGTGLGLSISDSLVRGHGGTLGYERTAEGNTRFVVELPNS